MKLLPFFLFATHAEAAETIKIFDFSKGHILITGMGLAKTEETLRQHIDKSSEIINFGIAGALHCDIDVGTLFEIGTVSTGTDHVLLSVKKTRLLSVSTPLHDAQERDRLSQSFHLVDMEGYAIAKIAQEHHKPCRLYKIVSDYCTETTSQDIRQRLPELSKQLAQYIVQTMKWQR